MTAPSPRAARAQALRHAVEKLEAWFEQANQMMTDSNAGYTPPSYAELWERLQEGILQAGYFLQEFEAADLLDAFATHLAEKTAHNLRRDLAVLLDNLYGLHVRPGHIDLVLEVVNAHAPVAVPVATQEGQTCQKDLGDNLGCIFIPRLSK